MSNSFKDILPEGLFGSIIGTLLDIYVKEYVLKQADGSEQVVKGYIPRAAPPTAPQFMASQQPSQRNAITSVDLRPYMTQVENQGKVGSCTANAAAGAYEYLVKRHLGYDAFEASRLFIYYNARYLDNQATGTKKIEDTGSSIGAAIESLKKWGACPESLWTYEPNLAFLSSSDIVANLEKCFDRRASHCFWDAIIRLVYATTGQRIDTDADGERYFTLRTWFTRDALCWFFGCATSFYCSEFLGRNVWR
jgi:hypothetical protein